MKTKTPIYRMALLGGVMALSFAFSLLAGLRVAQATSVCEAEIVSLPTTQTTLTLTPMPSVTAPLHAVSITLPLTTKQENETITADCVTLNGAGMTIIDTQCTINGVTMNPCILSANTFSVVALDGTCGPLTQDIPALSPTFNSQCTKAKTPNTCCTGAGTGTCSIPGVGGTITTSGPFAGCAGYGSVYPWSALAGNFIIGGGQTSAASVSLGGMNCPTVGEGAFERCISYTP